MNNTYKPSVSPEDICTDEQQFPTCPWCGFEHYENYAEFEESIYECENCEKEFEVKYVYRYTTEKVNDES